MKIVHFKNIDNKTKVFRSFDYINKIQQLHAFLGSMLRS